MPEVDGLRALAVLSVFLYHLQFSVFSGGFVGVDIFFVISGYLITGIILRGLKARSFSFFEFYARRFRRIYPALIVVLLVTCLVYGYLAPPLRVEVLGQTALATILSVANIFFWMTTSYFDPTSTQNPLLHTWSLGVEEQFYLLWPLALFLAVRFRQVLPFLIVSFLIGLVASEVMVRVEMAAAFYLTPFRIFQFAAGGLVYWAHEHKHVIKGTPASLTFVAGLAMALAAVFVFDERTAFPGLYALLPTLGAAAVIYARDAKPVSVILSNPGATYVGRISYSLYLTHWPTIVIYQQTVSPQVGISDAAIIVLFAFATAIALHHLVEQPARHAGLLNIRIRPSTVLSALGIVGILGFAGSVALSSGWAWRFPDTTIVVTQDELNQQRDRYWVNRPASRIEEGRAKIAIIGDSHAIDLYYALYGNDVPNLTILGYPFECDNVLDAGPDAGAERDWPSICKALFAEHLASPELAAADIILFNERWNAGDHTSLGVAIAEARQVNADAQIVIVGPKHQFLREPIDILDEQEVGVDINVVAAQYLIDRTDMDTEMAAFAAGIGAGYIDLYKVMCPPTECELTHDGSLTYFDNQHWTEVGATLFGGRLLASADYGALLTAPVANPGMLATPAANPAVVTTPAANPGVVATPAANPGVVATPAADPNLPATPAADPGVVVTPAADPAVVATPAVDPGVLVTPVADWTPMLGTTVPAATVPGAALVPTQWLDPENVSATPTDGPAGAMQATAAAVSGQHRVRYWFDSQEAGPAAVRWPIRFGSNEQFLIYIYNNDLVVYGSIQLKREGDAIRLVSTSGAVTAVAIASLDDGWLDLALDFDAKDAPDGSQFILYPTATAQSGGEAALSFSFAPPEMTWK